MRHGLDASANIGPFARTGGVMATRAAVFPTRMALTTWQQKEKGASNGERHLGTIKIPGFSMLRHVLNELPSIVGFHSRKGSPQGRNFSLQVTIF